MATQGDYVRNILIPYQYIIKKCQDGKDKRKSEAKITKCLKRFSGIRIEK